MTLRLELITTSNVPLEVEGVTPEVVRDRSIGEIEKLPIFHGNRKLNLADFFKVSGDSSDQRIEWSGDLAGVHWIGAKMSCGILHVAGDAGRHLGSEMTGGEIHVEGNAGDWVGGEMHGGLIQVRGRAGHLIGAAYRGSPVGMTGGSLLIHGSAGNEIGHSMRRGLIAIGGDIGDLVGFSMLAGSILIFGRCGIRPGAGMRRGTIAFLGPETPQLLPTFRRACRYQPGVLQLLAGKLLSHGFPVTRETLNSPVDLYNGDLLEFGKGEIFLKA